MAESPLFVKMLDFIAWLIPLTTKFPREQRFVIATRIQNAVFDAHESLIRAIQDDAVAAQHLADASTSLAIVRFYLRLAHQLSFVTAKSYEHASESLRELGLLVRAWQRKSQQRATLSPTTSLSNDAGPSLP